MGDTTARKRRLKSALHMDTVITLTVVTAHPDSGVMPSMERALQAFDVVEQACSRFSEDSEVTRLSMQIGSPVRVSAVLFEAIRFAWAMADATNGAFDPTVGRRLETYGFNRHYLTGETRDSGLDPNAPVSYRDLALDEVQRTVLLRKPLLIDLGALAKGLAVDLAARELSPFEGFVVDAGGDIYAGGLNERAEPWHIGIRHPLRTAETICSFRLTDAAVCTSGSYERPSPVRAETHHLIDPRSGTSRLDLLSCSVVAPFAMLADAMSTAAFVLGREKGMAHLEQAELDGIFVETSLEMHMTKTMMRYGIQR